MVFNFLQQTYTLARVMIKNYVYVNVYMRVFFCEREQREKWRKYQMKIHAISKGKKFLLSLLYEHFFRSCNFVLNFSSFFVREGEKGRVKRLTWWKILQFFSIFLLKAFQPPANNRKASMPRPIIRLPWTWNCFKNIKIEFGSIKIQVEVFYVFKFNVKIMFEGLKNIFNRNFAFNDLYKNFLKKYCQAVENLRFF